MPDRIHDPHSRKVNMQVKKEADSLKSSQAAQPQMAPTFSSRRTNRYYTSTTWENPWERIQATANHLDPDVRGLEGHIMTPETKQYAAMDPNKYDVKEANFILESKVRDELQFQYLMLATILAVDGRQRDKSYKAILQTRAERYKRRLDRWRWEKIFKPDSDTAGARVQYKQKEGEPDIDYHKRYLYASIVNWLEKTDENYRAMEVGWAKCKYITEHTLREILLLTEELWEERAELERVYQEKKGKPPAYYQSNWSGPLMQNE